MKMTIKKNKATDELLNVLNLASNTSELDAYITNLNGDSGFANVGIYLEYLLEEKGLKKSDIIQNSQLDRTYAYQIFNGTRIGGRDKMLAIGIAMQLSLKEMNRLVTINGNNSLYPKNRRDAIIIYCINHQYSLYQTNELLDERNVATI